MTSAPADPPPFRRAVLLMTSSSLLVPVAGLLTAPMLTQGLGIAGRGEAAAAVAPGVLLISVATLGLPEALTYFVAKSPRISREGLVKACGVGVLFGLLCFAAIVLAAPTLAVGDDALATLIVVATGIAVPSLVVNLMRGAASGRQMWGTVALERVLNSLLRVVALAVLLLTGQMTVLTAVLVGTLGPVVAGVVYFRLLLPVPREEAEGGAPFDGPVARTLFGFGARVWLGAVATMFLARIGQVLFAPLSSVEELGLYVVAVTVSDVPLLVAIAVRDALYGVNSRSTDAEQLTATARTTVLLGTVGCLVLGGTLPLWIEPVFGAGFGAATVVTWILMLSAVLNIPAFLASAALGAWGRPGLRSVGLAATLAVNLPLFLVLVPPYGAVGAALAAAGSSLFSAVFMVIAAARVTATHPADFLLPRRSDVARIVHESSRVVARFRRDR